MFKSALSALALIVLLPYARTAVYRFDPPKAFAGPHFYNPYATAGPGKPLRVNLHAHGAAWMGLTAGADQDADVLAAYQAAGYDVPVISNYQHISAQGSDALPVYEHGFNFGKHHQLAIGARQVTWFDLPLWQSVHQKQYVINRVAEDSELVALAHPAALQGYSYPEADLARLTGYQLLEVVNGPYVAESEWDAALSAGRAVWVIGDDDMHSLADRARFRAAWNMISSPSKKPADIIAALRAGATYTVSRESDGPDTTVAAFTEQDGVINIAIDGPPSQIVFVGQHGAIRKNVPDATSASYTFSSDDTYVRTVVKAPGRTLFLNPVVRYDGSGLTPAAATIDPLMTWTMRIALLATCFVFLMMSVRSAYRARVRARARRQSPQWEQVAVLVALMIGGLAPHAFGQDAPAPLPTTTVKDTPFASSFDSALLTALPTSDSSVFPVLETMQAEIASHRMSSGGIGFGTAAHLSALGSSVTQARFRLGDVDITDPSSGSAPLMLPELFLLKRLTTSMGLAAPDFGTPGLSVTLEPFGPGEDRPADIEVSSSFGDGLTASPGGATPTIARSTGWNRGSAIGSGSLAGGRGHFLVAGSASGASEEDRGAPLALDSGLVSAFASMTTAVSARDDLQLTAWLQRVTSPAAHPGLFVLSGPSMRDASLHLQSTWSRGAQSTAPWRVFAGYTQRGRQAEDALATTSTMERLLDGPPAMFTADTGNRTDRRFVAGSRTTRVRGKHALAFGADLDVSRATSDPGFQGVVGEEVDGLPSRMWKFSAGTESHRGSTTIGGFASDRLQLAEHKSLDMSLRYEWLTASADGAAQGIRWSSLLPRAMFRTAMTHGGGLEGFVGGGMSAYQLPLDVLAWGDPAASSLDVFRWTGGALSPAGLQSLYSLGGNSGRIDPDLKRPHSADFVIGIEARPMTGMTIQFEGLALWEKDLLGVVNESPSAPKYTIVNVLDPGLSGSRATDQVILVSNLVLPTTPYGFDNVLTNPEDRTARRLGAKMTVELTRGRLFVLLGATAFAAQGTAGNRGFLDSENDQGIPGDASYDPNGGLHAYGRLFGDRGFTGKLTTVYRFPADVSVGAITRYQDGQPFAGFALVPGLNQGPDVARAFANGGTRFTFTGSLDVRVQKGFAIGGGRRASAFLDVYNLTGLANEVDERAIIGTGFRTPASNQPPRTARLGARITF